MKRFLPLALALLLLTGCTSLPDASAPQPFDVSLPDSAPIQLAADGPSPDSDPSALVTDFLLACAAGANDDFATARLFLTSASAQEWNPAEQVLIYDTATRPLVKSGEEDGDRVAVTISAQGVASVDANGVLTRSTDSQIAATLALVKENGQWRIDAPENAFIISQASFNASYELVNLYFPATTGDALVPDPRWYPSRRLSAHLLKGLIAGPEKGISQAVTSAIPGGTTISSQGIEVREGVASVSLEAPVPESSAARSLLHWQIARTLAQDASISAVELKVSGIDLGDAPLPEGPAFSLDTRVGLNESAIGTISAMTVVPLNLAEQPLEGASAPAMSPVTHDLVAWRHEGELRIERGGAEPESARVTQQSSGAPSIDRFDYVWAAAPTGEIAARSDGTVIEVPIEGGEDAPVHSVAISPDGARALIVREGEEGGTLWIGAVLRDTEGAPRSILGLKSGGSYPTGVIDATWTDGTSFVVAVARADDGRGGGSGLIGVDLGGFGSAISTPEDIVSLSAGSSAMNLCVLDSRGGVHCRSGALWQDVPASFKEIRFPG